MKIILQIFIILLFFGCINNNVTHNEPLVNLIVQQDKYSLKFKYHFYKNFKNNYKNLANLTVKTNLSFTSSDTLSINGNNNLTLINGVVDFKIIDVSNTKIIQTGSISSSTYTGSVSSLYSVDENNNFAKERISKILASKLYRKILLSINNSEN